MEIIARGRRTADEESDCLILDHSETHLRLGLVPDNQHDALDDAWEREKREAKVLL